MRCPSCGFENPEGMKFCGQCASSLSPHCPHCGFENPPGFVFCGQCATPLTEQTPTPKTPDSRPQTLDSGLILRLQLVGANPTPQVAGLEELPGKVNYFLGNDPTQWCTSLPTYTKVKYQNVYPGVDLVYYGNQGQLEYDFVVAPGADPQAIQLTFEGADNLEVDVRGDLILQTAGGELRLHKPRVYQEIDGVQHEVSGSYVLLGTPAPNTQPPPWWAEKPN